MTESPDENKKEVSRKAARSRISLEQRQAKASDKRGDRFRILILLIGAILVIALTLDLSRVSDKQADEEAAVVEEIETLADGSRYTDPDGLFSIQQPKGWVLSDEIQGFNVLFKSPNDPDLAVLTVDVEDDSFKEMLRKIDDVDAKLGIRINHEIITFNGHQAVQRTARLAGRKILTIDYAADGRSHHLQYTAHVSIFDRYRDAVFEVMETYRPR